WRRHTMRCDEDPPALPRGSAGTTVGCTGQRGGVPDWLRVEECGGGGGVGDQAVDEACAGGGRDGAGFPAAACQGDDVGDGAQLGGGDGDAPWREGVSADDVSVGVEDGGAHVGDRTGAVEVIDDG